MAMLAALRLLSSTSPAAGRNASAVAALAAQRPVAIANHGGRLPSSRAMVLTPAHRQLSCIAGPISRGAPASGRSFRQGSVFLLPTGSYHSLLPGSRGSPQFGVDTVCSAGTRCWQQTRPISFSAMPPELIAKWRIFVAKVIVTSAVIALILVTFVFMLFDDWEYDHRRKLKDQPFEPMPDSIDCLAKSQVYQLSGHFVPNDYILVGPKARLMDEDEGILSQSVLTKDRGYEVIVPFHCNETQSIILLNLGFLSAKYVQRFIASHKKASESGTEKSKKLMFAVHLQAAADVKCLAWDRRWHTVRELAAKSGAEPLILEVLRGPYKSVGQPVACTKCSRLYATVRRAKDFFVRPPPPKRVSDVMPQEGEFVLLCSDWLALLVFAFIGVMVRAQVKRRFKPDMTYYRQYLKLKEETALVMANRQQAARSRRQLKG